VRPDLTSRHAIRGVAPRRAASRKLFEGRPSAPGPRIAAFDALRATAMMLVVVAHSAMAYVRVWPPRLLWAIRDPSRAMAFDALFWASVSVAMLAFFLLSGFCAARIYETRGPDGFARDRGRRIVGPFLLGAATILPPSLVVWSLGWLATGPGSAAGSMDRRGPATRRSRVLAPRDGLSVATGRSRMTGNPSRGREDPRASLHGTRRHA